MDFEGVRIAPSDNSPVVHDQPLRSGSGDRDAFTGGLLSQRVVTHKLRSRQRISITPTAEDSLYVLTDGVALVESLFGRDCPQISAVLFPGDTVIPSTMPPFVRSSIICTSKFGVVLQHAVAKPSGEAIAPELLTAVMTFNAARAALQNTILANLASEERVATLLIEFALRTGKPFAEGCFFDLPLARTDVALYLGLNPDTVSRNLATLKSEGLIKTHGRAKISCPDFNALLARSPVSGVLTQMLSSTRVALL